MNAPREVANAVLRGHVTRFSHTTYVASLILFVIPTMLATIVSHCITISSSFLASINLIILIPHVTCI